MRGPMNTFHRHLIEMTLSMVIPWSAFWMVVHFALPSAGLTPAWFFLMPIAIAVMVVPMTALMLYRRHSGRDIVEMNASMFAGMLLVMPVIHLLLRPGGRGESPRGRPQKGTHPPAAPRGARLHGPPGGRSGLARLPS